MSEPSYWYVDRTLPEHEQKMTPVCVQCQSTNKITGFYWPGHQVGYANHDINCSVCNLEIHKRSDEVETSV